MNPISLSFIQAIFITYSVKLVILNVVCEGNSSFTAVIQSQNPCQLFAVGVVVFVLNGNIFTRPLSCASHTYITTVLRLVSTIPLQNTRKRTRISPCALVDFTAKESGYDRALSSVFSLCVVSVTSSPKL